MIFDQTWMADLLELQKKSAQLAKGKNSVDEVQNLVMETLNKWGMNNLPWNNELESNQFFWSKNTAEPKTGQNWNVDISETKNSVFIEALIPGIEAKNDLTIKLQSNILYVSGKSNHLKADSNSFSREIRLPANVTTSGAEAIYQNDKLKVLLPKLTPEEGEFIPIHFFETE